VQMISIFLVHTLELCCVSLKSVINQSMRQVVISKRLVFVLGQGRLLWSLMGHWKEESGEIWEELSFQ